MNALLFVTSLCFAAALGATVHKSILADGPKCPAKPVQPVEAGELNITIGTTDPILNIPIGGGHHEGGVATGLHNLKYTYNFNIVGMTLTFEANIPDTVCLDGEKYVAKGIADFSPFRHETLPSGDFEGEGSYHGCMTDAHIKGSVSIRLNLIDQTISVTKVVIDDINADAVELDLGHFVVDGQVTDWAEWTANFEENWDADWAAHSDAFLVRVTAAANDLIFGMTLQELLDLISEGENRPCPPE